MLSLDDSQNYSVHNVTSNQCKMAPHNVAPFPWGTMVSRFSHGASYKENYGICKWVNRFINLNHESLNLWLPLPFNVFQTSFTVLYPFYTNRVDMEWSWMRYQSPHPQSWLPSECLQTISQILTGGKTKNLLLCPPPPHPPLPFPIHNPSLWTLDMKQCWTFSICYGDLHTGMSNCS